jgi:hypothetical protein
VIEIAVHVEKERIAAPTGKRVRWNSFERRPNGLGALRISQNLVPSKVTNSFQKFITLHTTVSEGFEAF